MAEINILDYANEIPSKKIEQPVVTEVAPAEPQEPVSAPVETVEPMSKAESFKYTFKTQTLAGAAWDRLTSPGFDPDENFKLTYGDIVDKWGKGIPEEYYDNLAEAESEQEISYKRDQILQRMEDQKRQDAMDVDDYAYSAGTAMLLDPVGLALGALTGGLASAALPASLNAIRAVRIGTGIVAGATETLANQVAIDAVDPTVDIKEAQYGFMTMLGGTMGGVGGAFSKAALKDAKRLELQHFLDNGDALTAKGKAYFADVAEQPFNVDMDSVETTLYPSARISITASLKSPDNADSYIKLGNILGEDGLANKSGKPLQPTIALDADTRIGQNLGDAMRGINEGYKQWGKETNSVNFLGRQYMKGREQFNEELSDVIRGIKKEAPTKGHAKAAQEVRAVYSRMLKEAKEVGLKNFDNLPDNPNYLPRIMRTDKIRAASVKVGKAGVIDMLTGSLKSNNPLLDDDYAATVAKAWFNRGHEVKIGDEIRFCAALSGENGDILKEMLVDEGVDAIKIDKIVSYFQDKGDGGIARSKRRIDFDEAYVDPNTGLKFTDLIENNVERLTTMYVHQVGGATAMAKFGFKTPQEFETHLQNVAKEAVDSGKMTKDQIEAMNRKAKNIANQILGRPNEDYTELKALGQMVMDYNYIRVGGGFSIASIPETFLTVAENGMKATLDRVPSLNKFFSKAAKGEADDELLDLIESFGVGRDIDIINTFMRNPEEDFLAHSISNTANLKNKTVKGLSVAKRTVGLASGLPHLTRFAQVFAAKSTIQRFTNQAFKNKLITKKWAAQLGLDDAMQQKVFDGIRKYAKTENGAFTNRKVHSINWAAWRKEDYDTAERFKYAIVRSTNRLIQKQLPGELPEFMSKTTGRMMFQFMSFGLAAYEKKTLNALSRRDLQTATAIALTSTIGSMTYVAQMYGQALAQDDPKAFLKERLATDQIIKAGIQRSGYLSILPPIIDTAAQALTLDPVFNQYARTSGLQTSMVSGNPTVQLLDSANKAVKTFPSKVLKGEIKEADMRNLLNLAPLRTLLGIQQLYEQFINSYPQSKTKQ